MSETSAINLYEHADYKGREVTFTDSCSNFVPLGFNDKVSSARVIHGTWRLWEHVDFRGRYYDIGPGDYNFRDISANIGNDVVSSVQLLNNPCIKLYEHADYKGKEEMFKESCSNFVPLGFNDQVSSALVVYGTWRLWEHIDFRGRYYDIGPGNYNFRDISANIGNDVVSSVQLLRPTVTLYEHADYKGREVVFADSCSNFVPLGFNDKVSSVRVVYGTWRLWEHVNYRGRYYDVGPGEYNYRDISKNIGNDVVSSIQRM